MMPFGVLYAVDGNPHFRRMQAVSEASLRRLHPDWPVEVVELPPPPVSALRRVYRGLSFWKAEKRRARAGQDMRSVEAKALAWARSPFTHTLFLDADTVVRRPLDALRARAMQSDVLATGLPWKQYKGLHAWQPETFPYVMSGVVFFNRRFLEAYEVVRQRIGSLRGLPTGDQFVFSLTLALQAQALRVTLAPELQLDVLNAAHHVQPEVPPRRDGLLDLAWPGLERFHVFHYNDCKLEYLEAIARTWGLRGLAHDRIG